MPVHLARLKHVAADMVHFLCSKVALKVQSYLKTQKFVAFILNALLRNSRSIYLQTSLKASFKLPRGPLALLTIEKKSSMLRFTFFFPLVLKTEARGPGSLPGLKLSLVSCIHIPCAQVLPRPTDPQSLQGVRESSSKPGPDLQR